MARPWRPANGIEGCDFAAVWCARCACDAEDLEEDDGCPIAAAAFAFDVKDDGYPRQWIEDESGPRCTAFIERIPGEPRKDPYAIEKARAAYDALPRDPVTGRPLIA